MQFFNAGLAWPGIIPKCIQGDKSMIMIGILSDTHMHSVNDSFLRQSAAAFSGCDIIIHAGDLTELSLLNAFKGKEIHAVCGNMCNSTTRQALPVEKQIIIAGYTIGITHGAGPRHNIEERVFGKYPTADCIIFGHTHTPVCKKIGHTLLINPGSFQGTGRYGAAGTYGLLHIDKNGLKATIHTLPEQL
jgi:putative phosphoesterase